MMLNRKRFSKRKEESDDFFGSPQKRNKNFIVAAEEKSNDRSLFAETVTMAGFIICQGDKPNVLSRDQAMFQRDVRRSICSNSLYSLDEAVDQFIVGLENHFGDFMRLKWALLYTKTTDDCETARGGQQDSLVRLLLNIDELQPSLIQLLTEKLLEVAHDDSSGLHIVDIPRLILANLRWLDHIVNSEALLEKVIEILEGSPLQVQQEVITFVPNIIDDKSHPRMAQVLCELYDSTPDLTLAILDALPHLTLPLNQLEMVQHSLLKTLQAVKPEHLPVVAKFLLHNTSCNSAYQVVKDMREKLQLPGETSGCHHHSPSKQVVNFKTESLLIYEVMLLNTIKTSSLVHRYLVTAWLKTTEDLDSAAQVRSLDFLLLFVLYDAVPSRRRPIESLWRNKIRQGVFTEALVDETFSRHSTAIKEYFDPVKKLSSLFLRSAEPPICHFGFTMYRCLFVYLDGCHQQEVILLLLAHLSDGESVRVVALMLLVALAQEYTTIMTKYAVLIKGALDIIEILSMSESKKLLDVITLLAYCDSSHSSLHDELAILVRKQLSHSDLKYKRIGVLSAVLCVKNMVQIDLDGSSANNSSLSSSTTSHSVREAEDLLHLVVSCTKLLPSVSALFMDEMASTILRHGVHTKLEEWISEQMTDSFQDSFVADYAPSGSTTYGRSILMEPRWNLEDEADEKTIMLNLAPLVVAAEKSRTDDADWQCKLTLMAPQFRLLRMVESHLHSGDLTNIDALLGCPVFMPADSVYQDFELIGQAEKHATLSCLFFVVNWFRELLNAFVTQKDMDLKRKVYQRLRQVIELQGLLLKLLPSCPSYRPPLAVFDTDPNFPLPSLPAQPLAGKNGNGKRGRKSVKGNRKQKLTAAADVTQKSQSQAPTQARKETQAALSQSSAEEATDQHEVICASSLPGYNAFLRELHLDVFCLLFRTLSLDPASEVPGQLTLAEAEFLLNDLNLKLSRAFQDVKRTSVLGKGTDKMIGFSHLDLFSAKEIAHQVHRFLKPICVHLEKIKSFFQDLMNDSDGLIDANSMFTKQSIQVRRVYSLLFASLASYLSWCGFQRDENRQLSQAMLSTIVKRLDGVNASQMDREHLAMSAFQYVSNFRGSLITLETAIVMVRALESLAALAPKETVDDKLVEVVESLLKRDWNTTVGLKEKGALYNQQVFFLLQVYLKKSSSPLALVDNICSGPLQEFLKAPKKNQSSEAFPTFNKGTIGVYYRLLLEYLVMGVKKSLADLPDDSDQRLESWNSAIRVFHELISTLKIFDSRGMLAPCLKYSRQFLDLFLRSGMPLLDLCLREHNEEVITLLKNLQSSTRSLQHLCTHSKVKRDATLTRYVPLVKKSLETLVYRVKAMLAVNKCASAFWMGNLKNRDLKGEEISSQVSNSELEDEEEDDEVPIQPDPDSDIDLDDESADGKEVNSGKDQDDESIDMNEYSSSF